MTNANLAKAMDHIFDFEKLKYCFECGICTASCPVAELLPQNYNPRILLHNLPLGDDNLLKSTKLWLCAWCYRCYIRCPQNLKLPEIFHIARKFAAEIGYMEGFNKALEIIREEIPLPASCCYVCFHPKRSIDNEQIVTDAIQNTILDYALRRSKKKSSNPVFSEKVAIIGAGPAGLSAAQDLATKGYSVTIFEALSSAGGMLRQCIPEYRLPKKIVDSDISCIKSLGVKIKTNTTIGQKLTMQKLVREGYDAIFVATGAHEEQRLNIEGEDLNGVFYALDFLEKANKNEVLLSGKVSIIGGGNVAVDSAGTTLRLGAEEVTIFYRRSKAEMPANPWEIMECEQEGVKIEFLVAPKRILGKNGKVKGIEFVRMELREPDESGRRRPIPISGSEFVIPTNTVILAVGQFPNTTFLPETVEITENRTIVVDPFTLETSSPNIFAGGDAVSGPRTLMEAIISGKRAASSIDLYLRGNSLQSPIAENFLRAENGKI